MLKNVLFLIKYDADSKTSKDPSKYSCSDKTLSQKMVSM